MEKTVKINNFDSIKDFASYAEWHYLPLLSRLSECKKLDVNDRRLLSFLHDDLTSLVNNSTEAQNG